MFNMRTLSEKMEFKSRNMQKQDRKRKEVKHKRQNNFYTEKNTTKKRLI